MTGRICVGHHSSTARNAFTSKGFL